MKFVLLRRRRRIADLCARCQVVDVSILVVYVEVSLIVVRLRTYRANEARSVLSKTIEIRDKNKQTNAHKSHQFAGVRRRRRLRRQCAQRRRVRQRRRARHRPARQRQRAIRRHRQQRRCGGARANESVRRELKHIHSKRISKASETAYRCSATR